MSTIVKTLCDRTGCKNENAKKLHLFKERKQDRAGSMEDRDYVFYLCPDDEHNLLIAILDQRALYYTSSTYGGIRTNNIVNLLEGMGIKYRVE